MSAEIFTKKFYKHHTDNMYLSDVIPDPSKDEVFIYELPEKDNPDAVVLPVFNATTGTIINPYSRAPSLEDFGIPFYITVTSDEENDYDKIYDKIRWKYIQFS